MTFNTFSLRSKCDHLLNISQSVRTIQIVAEHYTNENNTFEHSQSTIMLVRNQLLTQAATMIRPIATQTLSQNKKKNSSQHGLLYFFWGHYYKLRILLLHHSNANFKELNLPSAAFSVALHRNDSGNITRLATSLPTSMPTANSREHSGSTIYNTIPQRLSGSKTTL